ncbi:hypothetical protein ACFPRL_13075 [Pseudoclavibacter helvolus]
MHAAGLRDRGPECGSGSGAPAVAEAALARQHRPHRWAQRRVLRRDAAHELRVVRAALRRLVAAPLQRLGAHEQHNKLVDARQLLHEAPRILASACPAVDHGLALVLRFGAQDLEAGSPGQFVALGFHSTSLRATSPSRLVLWNPTALPSREDNASA